MKVFVPSSQNIETTRVEKVKFRKQKSPPRTYCRKFNPKGDFKSNQHCVSEKGYKIVDHENKNRNAAFSEEKSTNYTVIRCLYNQRNSSKHIRQTDPSMKWKVNWKEVNQ